ncbi:MAG: FIST signal transduction protein [Candidatus Thorarchaeota archaeon]
MDRIRTGIFSAKTNIPYRAGKLAVESALRQTLDRHPALCLIFFSERYASPELIEGITQVVSPEIVVGCSTNGEIASGYWRESVIAMILSTDYMRFGLAVEDNEKLANGSSEIYKEFYQAALYDLKDKITNHKSKLNLPENLGDIKPDFGILLLPSTDPELRPKSNEVIKGLREHLGDLPLIGGTIGDDSKYEKGYVIFKDEFLENHTLLILAYSDLKFSMSQKHGYQIKQEYKIEKAYDNNLVTLNGQSASEVYFNSIGLPIVEISDHRDEICAINPLGVKDEVTKDLQILFPMARGKGAKEINLSQIVPEGKTIYLLEADKEKAKLASLDSIKSAFSQESIKDPRVGLIFSCIGRSTFYFDRALDEIEEIKKRFKYTDIGGAYLYGTLCGRNNWVSEGTTSTLLIDNEIREDRKKESND